MQESKTATSIETVKRNIKHRLTGRKNANELEQAFFPYFSQLPSGKLTIQQYILSAMLTYEGLSGTKFGSSFSGKKTINILSIGCGLAPDFLAFLTHFNKMGIKVTYHGIDRNAAVIKQNKETFKHFPSANFSCQDATNITCIAPNTMDVVVFQHPNLLETGYEKIWEDIFEMTLPKMIADNGHVYISCYRLNEMAKCGTMRVGDKENFLRRSAYRITNDENSLAPRIPYQGEILTAEAIVYCSNTPIKLTEFNLPKLKRSDAPTNNAVVASTTSKNPSCCVKFAQFFASYVPQQVKDALSTTPVAEQKKTM